MTIPKTSRLCNTNPVSRDDANATVRDLNARIDSVYKQAFGQVYSAPAVALALPHGVPTLIPNPLGTNLQGVVPLNCDTQAMPSLTVTTAGAPAGQAFLTALYPLAEQFVQLVTTSGQIISNLTLTAATFPASPTIKLGTNISYNGSSNLTFNVKGLFDIRGSILFGGGSTAGGRSGQVMKVGGGAWTQNGGLSGTASTGTGLGGSVIVSASIGDSYQFVLYQDSGGNLTTGSSASNLGVFEARQLSNDSSLTANVTYALLS